MAVTGEMDISGYVKHLEQESVFASATGHLQILSSAPVMGLILPWEVTPVLGPGPGLFLGPSHGLFHVAGHGEKGF